MIEAVSINAGISRPGQAIGLCLIAYHAHHLRRNSAIGAAVHDGLQVATAATDQYNQPAQRLGFSQRRHLGYRLGSRPGGKPFHHWP